MIKSLKNIWLRFIKYILFYEHRKEKIKVDRNDREYMLFRTDVDFTEWFLAVEIDEQNHEGRELILEKKRQEALEKELGCKFIRTNTSDAKRGYDTDDEVSKLQIFISKFKDKKKNKRKRKQNKKLEGKKKKKKNKTSMNKSKC